MKIATYHRMMGDSVTFFKGDPKDFAAKNILSECLKKLNSLPLIENWDEKKDSIEKFIKTGKKDFLDSEVIPNKESYDIAKLWIQHYSQKYRKKEYGKYPEYDRIYVTTLFTFYWRITINAIEDAKLLVKDQNELKVGGVLATLLAGELEATTGIKPLVGLLDKPGILDDNDIVVDDLPLDYSILDEIDYQYPTGSAYFTFMTKGCTRTCSFCSVPKLEPTYKEKIPTIDKFVEIKNLYGEQRNLLLMDNNVLASPKFPEIIQEIKDMGFTKDAKYIEPNQLDIAVANLKKGINNQAYLRRIQKLLQNFRKKSIRGKAAENFDGIIASRSLKLEDPLTKEQIIGLYKEIKDIYEKYRDKTPKQRYVDFNQGTDARYVTEEYMKLLSEIPINPLRIAFDHISLKKTYEKAIHLAAQYGINRLSNYLLFNFNDRPEDLYHRMKINVNLSNELGIHIYSFPMKYIPLFGEEAKHRRYIGKHWNKKFIRAIQSISNATRGIIPAGKDFFERAFGKNVDEYFELLYMPETYLIFRKLFDEDLGFTQEWRYLFSDQHLNEEEKELAKRIIEENDFSDFEQKTSNKKIHRLLNHYLVKREDVNKPDEEYENTKHCFDRLIEEDQFVNLTLTYDWETPFNEGVFRSV
jgi:hypothetical protein